MSINSNEFRSESEAQPTLQDEEHVIKIENLFGGYDQRKPFIHNLNLKVKKGEIYSLLGPSAAGKTTLLKLILGLLIKMKGKISIFGEEPSLSLGPKIGYMPQDLSLYEQGTAQQVLRFFATLNGVDKAKTNSRIKTLMEFLQLPKTGRSMSQLSGGQRRRVSLAIALLHEPDLLILDEPTVGVDPLLRQKIWGLMRSLTKKGVTVIITTHYIEEAIDGDAVGFIRNGTIIEEGKPYDLMKKHKCNTLEDTFLALCKKKDKGILVREQSENEDANELEPELEDPQSVSEKEILQKDKESSDSSTTDFSDQERSKDLISEYEKKNKDSKNKKKRKMKLRLDPKKIWAITKIKYQVFIAYKIILLFSIALPTLLVLASSVAFGKSPHSLNFAIITEDEGLVAPEMLSQIPLLKPNDGPLNLGDEFAKELKTRNKNPSSILHVKTKYKTIGSAREAIEKGDLWGVLYIPKHFTFGLFLRFYACSKNHTIIEWSIGDLYMDMSNAEIGLTIVEEIDNTFVAVGDRLLQNRKNQLQLPYNIEKPIYGKLHPKYKDFVTPGIMIMVGFSFPMFLGSIGMVREAMLGVTSRIWATGTGRFEVVLGTVTAITLLLLLQLAVLFPSVIYGFKVPMEGNIFYVLLDIFSLGLFGQSLGALIGFLATHEFQAMIYAFLLFFINYSLAGSVWPALAQPQWLYKITQFLPTSRAVLISRSVMSKGWGFKHQQVWFSFVIVFLWLIIFVLLTGIFTKTTIKPKTPWFWEKWFQMGKKKKKKKFDNQLINQPIN
ncbi:hypothetical protein M0812_07981 [Anaeramoeba flamelloides]|uniref:Uncharacterized protein n=1 Tax=Anaeramoeba flamelloides TaxID=1746091 RepID=A0AAV8A1N8_9EUKA|nr:hypothetical protein M0812_07981 [Anaeramoeba flamelloides]